MRLTDLNPSWISLSESVADGQLARHGMGVSFDCPHCRTERLAVKFANPVDGREPFPDQLCLDKKGQVVRWQRSGDTFDSLTLTPSVDASKDGHWHGMITNGVIA